MILPMIVALRHPREKRSKCSLTPIEGRPNTFFRRARDGFRYDGTAHLLLATDAPVIGPEDAYLSDAEASTFADSQRVQFVVRDEQGRALRPVLLLDSVWRLLPAMRSKVYGTPIERSLPKWVKTAYPRESKMTDDPECGLATIEALYASLRLMGWDASEVLDGYRWKDEFLRQFDERS